MYVRSISTSIVTEEQANRCWFGSVPARTN